jgi:hypothetical protein
VRAAAGPLPPPPAAASSSSDAASADAAAVGRYGEELAYHYLTSAAAASGGGWDVIWENAAGESGLPYDIRLAGPDGAAVFVEVKASRSAGKQLFEMSRREFEFAEAAGDWYHILRLVGVGGAGSGGGDRAPGAGAGPRGPRVERLVNPALLWRAGAVRVCVVL